MPWKFKVAKSRARIIYGGEFLAPLIHMETFPSILSLLDIHPSGPHERDLYVVCSEKNILPILRDCKYKNLYIQILTISPIFDLLWLS